MITSLSFFLFSFQVHEKTILLVTLPVNLLPWQHPFFVMWFNAVAAFSMYPLLVRDGLALPTWAMTSFYIVIFTLVYGSKFKSWTEVFLVCQYTCICVIIYFPPLSCTNRAWQPCLYWHFSVVAAMFYNHLPLYQTYFLY